MKSKNLQLLQEHNIRVPKFTVVHSVEDVDSTFLFFLPSGQKYAVRSSFDAEDSVSESYAGQFDTFLNVEKWELRKRVQQVLDSASKKNVQQYCDAKNIDHSLSGGVIIQEMVQADLSGVIFTANPLGILNETVIVIGRGLGCNVVEDKTDTTSYYYNQDDEVYYFEQQGESPLIDDALLQELVELSKRIKDIFNYEADIEFAVKDGVVYILQTRPITTLDMDNPIILDNSNIVESYPGISLPLTQDFVRTIYHEIFYNLVARISKDKNLASDMDKYLVNMTDVANWRIYYRITNWYAVLKLLPFSKKIISMWQNMLGVNNKTISAPCDIKVTFFNKMNVVFSVLHYLKKCPAYMDELNGGFASRIKEYEELIANQDKPSELLQVYESIRTDIMENWDITLINDMYTFIYTALVGKKNKELISNIKNLESMKPVYALRELQDIAEGFGVNSEKYRTAVNTYIAQYGDRCLCELKLETRTYRTNPELLEDYILRKCERGKIKRKVAEENDCKDGFFIKRAKIGIKNREISRMNRSRIFGLARTIFDKIGTYMVSNNLLDVAEDVYYLYIDELYTMQDYRHLVLKRKAEQTAFANIPAYSRLVFSDNVINKQNYGGQSRILKQNNELWGIATSVGKVRGEALVIDEPSDKIDSAGKILITKSTDPGWVFLIQNASGIIAEKGSLLSHTAIISRELCKPAIVNVKDCTKLIHSGDIVELDAECGCVTILSEGCPICEK